jgi:hypothetical protein
MVGAEFAKKGKTFNLIHQASQLKRKAVIKQLARSKIVTQASQGSPTSLVF